jgi:hypothetical protein
VRRYYAGPLVDPAIGEDSQSAETSYSFDTYTWWTQRKSSDRIAEAIHPQQSRPFVNHAIGSAPWIKISAQRDEN